MLTRTNLLLTFCLICSLQAQVHYFFEPPKNWQCVDPKTLSPSVEIGFVGKGKSKYYPTINLASEDVDISLNQYVKEVKKIHRADKNTSLRELGSLKTKAGTARLLELSTKTKFGTVKMLQAIWVKYKKAIVLTAAVQKDEFMDMYKTYLKAIRSFTFTNELTDPIQDPKKKQALQSAIAELKTLTDPKLAQKKLKKIQKMIQKNYQELGSHWQILILNQIQTTIANLNNASPTNPL